MPEGAVYVGRPTIFGNPFLIQPAGGASEAVLKFRKWLGGGEPGVGGLRRIALLARVSELRGKDLACFCPLDRPCHADVLLEIAEK